MPIRRRRPRDPWQRKRRRRPAPKVSRQIANSKASSKVAPVVQGQSPLVELPTELLDSICHAVSEYVSEGKRFPDHPRDLLHLGQTCRRMYRVVQQTLYREIVAGCTGDGRPRRVSVGDLVCRFQTFGN